MKPQQLKTLVKAILKEVMVNERIQDPAKAEMMAYLKSQYGNEEGWEDNAEVAIYWFANFYHGGQWSNLYSALSTSPFRPGPIARGPEKDSMEEMMYQDLVHQFAAGEGLDDEIKESNDSTCQKCKGKGYHSDKIQNVGTRDYEDHIVPCDFPGCHGGKVNGAENRHAQGIGPCPHGHDLKKEEESPFGMNRKGRRELSKQLANYDDTKSTDVARDTAHKHLSKIDPTAAYKIKSNSDRLKMLKGMGMKENNEDAERSSLISQISDDYKSLHGIRPRGMLAAAADYPIEKLRQIADELSSDIQADIKREKQDKIQHQAAVKKATTPTKWTVGDITGLKENDAVNHLINGQSNNVAASRVNKVLSSLSKGLFSDNSWEAIHKIFNKLQELGLDVTVESAKYGGHADTGTGMPKFKEWQISIPFTNKNGKPSELVGTITAHGAGSVEQPLDKYDITAYVSAIPARNG